MPTTTNPTDHLPLTPTVFHILLALADQARHGYGIIQEIEYHTGGRLRMAPGSLYGAINRLRTSGWIEECDPPLDAADDDERRRYYRLTITGRAIAHAEAARLAALVHMAQSKHLLDPATHTGNA